LNFFKAQGIYCFGGKKENGLCTNELKILNVSKKKYVWSVVKTKGMPPLPRY